MTREEILATTYPLPTREEDRETNLRAVVDYDNPPPTFVFEGPLSIPSLRRRQRYAADVRLRLEEAFERGEVPRLEFETKRQRNAQHLEALEKAIPMAEAGWEIYSYRWFLAVLESGPPPSRVFK
jgi:hypothetical protein